MAGWVTGLGLVWVSVAQTHSCSMGGIVGKHKKQDTSLPKSESQDFTTEVLRSHNVYRQQHGVPPLTISRKLCKYSEEWANHLAETGKVEHRQDSEYGENIFSVNSSEVELTGSEPVDSWYSEGKDHQYDAEPASLSTGHFTQLVWRDSKKLGVALARSKKHSKVFVVANYSPPGNYVGCYEENVFPCEDDVD